MRLLALIGGTVCKAAEIPRWERAGGAAWSSRHQDQSAAQRRLSSECAEMVDMRAVWRP